MAVRLRLTRCGTTGRPYFRIAAMDARMRRDGRTLEILGTYHPLEHEEAKRLDLRLDRVDEWIAKGAQPTEKVAALVRSARRRATATP